MIFICYSRKELETREFLSDAEFQEALAKEVAKEERKHEQDIKEYQEKIDTLNQQYMDLENEFRIALTVEARRYKDVRTISSFLLKTESARYGWMRELHFRILALFTYCLYDFKQIT